MVNLWIYFVCVSAIWGFFFLYSLVWFLYNFKHQLEFWQEPHLPFSWYLDGIESSLPSSPPRWSPSHRSHTPPHSCSEHPQPDEKYGNQIWKWLELNWMIKRSINKNLLPMISTKLLGCQQWILTKFEINIMKWGGFRNRDWDWDWNIR